MQRLITSNQCCKLLLIDVLEIKNKNSFRHTNRIKFFYDSVSVHQKHFAGIYDIDDGVLYFQNFFFPRRLSVEFFFFCINLMCQQF